MLDHRATAGERAVSFLYADRARHTTKDTLINNVYF